MAHDEQPAAAPHISADAVAATRAPARPTREMQPQHLYQAVGLAFFLAIVFKFFDTISHVFLMSYAAAILAVGLNA
ncbi:MAG TPA: hypothetical protein VE913_23225, partial [Longimicrobium sp.]|nr:hypothetical protein [Longimicrobium sp.]